MAKIFYTFLLFVFLYIPASAQTVSGKIITRDGSPAANVNIELKDLRLFAITNENGEFSFNNIAPGNYTVVASYSGLQTRQFSVELKKESVSVKITLLENSQQLEEIIVQTKKNINDVPLSVGKIAINPMDLPQSISVIGENTIREQQVQRLSDVVKNVNGVYLSTTRGSVQESFSARGYSFSSSNMFKNGSRVNSGVMPELSSLEKVEILKGSSSILYGNVAPGGIINMVTKQPKFDAGGEISFRTGSYGFIKPAFDFYGAVSKKIAFRINGTYEKADSYRDVVSSKKYYINPSMLFQLSNKTQLLLQGDYLNHQFTPDFGIGSLDNTKIPDVKRSAFLGTSWQYNKAKQTTATATLKHKINESWNLTASASYQLYKRDYYSTERIQALANGDWGRPLNKIKSEEDYLVGQIDVTGKFKTGNIQHKLLAGVDADRYYTTTYSFDNPTFYDSINILDPGKFIPRTDIPSANKIKSVYTPIYRSGVYVQDLISLTYDIKLLAGIRWSQQKSSPATTTFLQNDSIVKAASKSDQAFTPRLGIVYQPTKNISVFGSYANSFSINSGTDVYGNALAPSMIDQYELGIKNEFLNKSLNLNLTFYKIINNNLAQTAQFAADGTTPNNNISLKELVGQTTSNGIELDIQGQPINGLNILAGYSYNDIRFTKTKAAKGNYIEGERLVNNPANTANVSAFYTFQNKSLKNLKVGVSVYYIGDRLAGWNNTQQQAQQYSRLISIKGFTTADMSVSYTYHKLNLIAKVSNIFDTYNYYVHENYSVNPIAPTQFFTTISYKF